jgi:hypothetical protein
MTLKGKLQGGFHCDLLGVLRNGHNVVAVVLVRDEVSVRITVEENWFTTEVSKKPDEIPD